MSDVPFPTVQDFRDIFTEFAGKVSDSQVSRVLDMAKLWIDVDLWEPEDYFQAVLYWSAHWISLVSSQGSANSVAAGLTGETDLFVRMIRAGGRTVAFQQRTAGQGSNKQAQAPGEDMLSRTIYG